MFSPFRCRFGVTARADPRFMGIYQVGSLRKDSNSQHSILDDLERHTSILGLPSSIAGKYFRVYTVDAGGPNAISSN